MSLAIVHSRAQAGIDAPPVTVEVHLSGGLPALSIVGLPETAVKESKDRVRAALLNAGFEFPARRITVNLAPAELPKAGGRFDLPIAVGILAATGQVPKDPLARHELVGELALTGELRPVRGALTVALGARSADRALILPLESAAEAGLVAGARVLPADELLAVTAHLIGSSELDPAPPEPRPGHAADTPDLAEVVGQHRAKRALEVAAAGGHNLLFVGPPGTGKSMLAGRLPGILPPMTEAEALEAAAVASISDQGFDPAAWSVRRFRSPHHTASSVALVGGGSPPRPGEVSLAHQGVLFLDELPEFQRRVLEVLREPLESGAITISRAAHQAEFPAAFQLVAAMNPCPCGHLGESRCRCSEDQVGKYRARVSGPLLDRIDLQVEVPRESPSRPDAPRGEDSRTIRRRVCQARQRQIRRQNKANHRLGPHELAHHCRLDEPSTGLLDAACERLGLSTRARHRILKLARTIADLAAEDTIAQQHLAEAITYRQLDRNYP